MAADGGLLTGGPGLSRCQLLAARSSVEPSTPDRPLKVEGQTEGKSNQADQMIKHSVPFGNSYRSHTSVKIRSNFSLSFR